MIATDPHAAPPPLLLLVEDDPLQAKALRTGLEMRGFVLLHAPTCEEARHAVAEEAIALMLLDLNLPDGDGLDLLEHLRTRGVQTPAMILSNRDRAEDRLRARRAGALRYLIKADTSLLMLVEFIREVIE